MFFEKHFSIQKDVELLKIRDILFAADDYSEEENFQEALNLLDGILNTPFKKTEFLKELGKLPLKELDTHPDQKAVTLSYYLTHAYLSRGLIKRDNFQQYSEALKDFNQAIEYRYDSKAAYLQRFSIYKRLFQNKEALEDLNLLISLGNPFPRLYIERSLVHQKMGNFEEALKDCESALLLSKVYYTYLTRGNIKEHFKEFEKALEDYNQAVLIVNTQFLVAPFNENHSSLLSKSKVDSLLKSKAYTARGRFKLRQGDLQGALEDFSQIKVFRDLSILFKAEIQLRQGDLEGALEAYNQTVKKRIDYPYGYQHRGNYFYEQKDFAQAQQDFQKFLEITSEIENDIFIEKARQEVQEKLLLLQQD
jgi:tetratricopeptide (TPR) repeat protein